MKTRVVSQEFLDAVKILILFRGHRDNCDVVNTETCTCGMKIALDNVNRLYVKDNALQKSED